MSLPTASELLQARRVLCVQPHYDDNDLGAGGTIAALAAAGAEVCYLTVTDDLVGVLDPELSEDEAGKRLRADQARAAEAIGVARHVWLGLPDAGSYDYFELRRGIIEQIRHFRPDWLFSVDPWLPYESHRDHLLVGRAVSEALLLYRFPRLRTDPEVDRAYTPHPVEGIAYYFTREANRIVDIGGTRACKHRALDAYVTQLTPEDRRRLHAGLEAQERAWARGEDFEYAEALRVLRPGQLHVHLGESPR
ncbi:MAG: PIG-L deacetylase family protein [Myxococcota bacterium]